jgi:hypothetical protein
MRLNISSEVCCAAMPVRAGALLEERSAMIRHGLKISCYAAFACFLCQPVQADVVGEVIYFDELAEEFFGGLSVDISTTDLVEGFTANTDGFPLDQSVNESAVAPYGSGVVDLINNVNSWLMDTSGGDLGCLRIIDLLPSDGFFPGLPPNCPQGGLEDLTDGVAGNACKSVLRDFARASLVVRFGFENPTDVGRLHVFGANFNDRDGRVFQSYDVWARQGDCSDGTCPAHGTLETTLVGYEEFFLVQRGVRTGDFGLENSGIWQGSLTRVLNFDSDILVEDCTDLRFVFYSVSNPDAVFLDPFQGYEAESQAYRDACSNGSSTMQEDEDEDGRRKAFVASIIKEIDVLEPQPTPTADIDYDDDIDLFDLAAMQRCFGNDVSTNGCYRFDVDENGAFDAADWDTIAPLATGPQ